jgi:hypothetical protein
MRRVKRVIGAGVLVLLSGALFWGLVEYREQPLEICPGAYDVICAPSDELLGLGNVDIEPPPDSAAARYHGKIAGGKGLFARHGIPRLVAGIGGGAIPVLLLIGALVLTVRRARSLDDK